MAEKKGGKKQPKSVSKTVKEPTKSVSKTMKTITRKQALKELERGSERKSKKKSKKEEVLLLLLLIILLIGINYPFLDKIVKDFLRDYELGIVERVIDGDTIEVDIYNDTSIRFLGINSPEKGEPYYKEAKDYLESAILDNEIKIKFGKERYDKYDRVLAYVFIRGRNVNMELVENGLANIYFPDRKDKNFKEFSEAWETCIMSQINLCEYSENVCTECLELKIFDPEGQRITIYNNCFFECNLHGWSVKDEGRKKLEIDAFVLQPWETLNIWVDKEAEENYYKKNELTKTSDYIWAVEEYVWTESGDTLFIRDEEGKLVFWKTY